MKLQCKIWRFGPWLEFNNGIAHVGCSLHFHWPRNSTCGPTFGYVCAHVSSPFWRYNGEWFRHSFRIGKHVDFHGRLYIYLGYVVLWQDVFKFKHRREYPYGKNPVVIWT